MILQYISFPEGKYARENFIKKKCSYDHCIFMIVFFYCLNCLLSLYIFLFIYFSSYLSLPRSLFSKLLIAAYMFISHSLFLFLSLLLTHSFLDILYCLFLCHSILPYLHTLPSVFFTVYSTV